MPSKQSADYAGNLAKMKTVMSREYFSRVRTKGFVLGTLLLPIFMVAILVVPTLTIMNSSDETKRIGVIDLTGEISDRLETHLDAKNDEGKRIYNLIEFQADSASLEQVKSGLAAQLMDGILDAYLVIPEDIYRSNSADIIRKSSGDFRELREIRGAMTRAVVDQRLLKSGLAADSLSHLVASVDLIAKKPKESGEEREDGGELIGLAWIMVFFLYMTIIIYGNIMMRSVLEEKTSRVVESVISSIKPFYLMAGKIVGVGAVGITQFIIWAAAAAVLSLYGAGVLGFWAGPGGSGAGMPSIPLSILIYFVVFFVLGYFLYATMYAGVGSIVNSDQEAQQMGIPMVLFLVIPMMIMWTIIANPDSQTSVILSMIPFFSPMIMLVRIIVQTPPAWEIAASITLLVLTLVLNIWLVGKIFRVGVLMYGKRPTLPEIIKWVRHA